MAGLRREDRFHTSLSQRVAASGMLMPFLFVIPWQGLRFIDRPALWHQLPLVFIMDDTQYPIVRGAVQLSAGSEIITDVDEEIFILYSNLQSAGSDTESSGFRGLGHLDSRKDVLDIIFDLKGVSDSKSKDSRKGKKSKAQRTHESDNANDKTIQIELYQDKTALRTRKGDTGSVIWKASIDFAQYVLQQNYTNSTNGLFHHERLRNQHVLELGAGTGLLSMVLSPLVRRYTATDIGPLIPLIQKNVSLNFAGWPKLPLVLQDQISQLRNSIGSSFSRPLPLNEQNSIL